MRAQADIDAIVQDLKSNFETIKREMTAGYTRGMTAEAEASLAWLETFSAISVRVMRHTNPSKLREAARAEEIKARMEGRAVLED